MKQFIYIPCISVLLFLTACSGGNNEKKSLDEHQSLSISDTYNPSTFQDPDRTGKIAAALDAVHCFYSQTAETRHLPGVAYGLVVDDSLVFKGGYGSLNLETGEAVTVHSLFRIASMTKSFTAMAILQLRDQGLLSLNDPVDHFLPELKDLEYLSSDAPPVSIFNLLTMTAGFPEDNPWGDRFLDMADKALMEQVDRAISFSTVTSLHYEYSNLGYGLLGQVISRISGMSFQDYITRNILQALGMNNTFWEYSEVPDSLLALGYRWEDGVWVDEPLLHDGAFGSMGGLITSITDFSKYISFHLSAWPARSDPDTGPLKRSSLREMHRMNNPRYYTDPMRFGDQSSPIMRGYGFGLVAMKDHNGVVEVGHNGGLPGFGSSYMFYPQYGIGIMAFSNLTYVGGKVRTANYMVMKTLISEGLFKPRVLPPSDILKRRQEEVLQLISSWDPDLEQEIVAANLYMDLSRERRMKDAEEMLDRIGEITRVDEIVPENQLRGAFLLHGTRGTLEVFFTLTPEAEAKVQWLSLGLVAPE